MKLNAVLIASALGLSSATPMQKRATLEYFGINESGAEFGNNIIPGNEGKEFTFPSTSTIDTLISDGFNTFRIAFLMERLVPTLTGTINAAYLKNLTTVVDHITSKGSNAIIDPHNFGRFNGAIIEDVDGFGAWWKTVAVNFKDNDKVIFDTNNEYHDMAQDLVLNLNQAAIDNIRAAGATTQPIFVEGNSYSGAWTWNTTNDNLKALTDPSDKLVYEMHQYLDTDGSGTHEECVSSTIGAERVSGATAWLKANGKKGIIGEFAGGANDQCKTAVKGLLDHLSANTDVWTGALWWAAGPWWGDYIYSFEPPSGTGYTYYADTLKSFA